MILLRDFALFVLPVLVGAAGWLYAISLRRQSRLGQLVVASCARTDIRKCS